MIRLWLIIAVLTVVSWFILRTIRKPINLLWVLLFWVVAIFGSLGLIYGLSVLLAQESPF